MLLLFVVTFALYARSANFPFTVLDDALYVFRNSHVASGLSIASIRWAFTSFHASNWHPVTWLSLMTDSQLWGLNPMGFHLVNVLLHALNASLLFLLLYKMTGALQRSALVAALFALHPLHVESVVWITERKDVLSFLLLLLTLFCYLAYVRSSRRLWYLSALVVYAVGLMAKPMLVTLPLLLLLLDYWPLGRLLLDPEDRRRTGAASLSRLAAEKLPFLLLAGASSWVTILAQHDTISTLEALSLPDRVGNALWSTLSYLEKTVLPYRLALFYPYHQLPAVKVATAALLLCLISILVVKYAGRSPYLVTSWFWFLITLLPVIGLIQVGAQAMADRYTYLPLVGLFIMVSWGGAEICARHRGWRPWLQATAAAAVPILALLTWVQTGYWSSNVKLAEHAIEVTEANPMAYFCLGRAWDEQGNPELAELQYRTVLKINPDDEQGHANLGSLLINHGKVAEAIGHLLEAVRLAPNSAENHYSLGVAYAKIGQLDQAIDQYYASARLEPDAVKCLNNLGVALAQRGRLDEAIRQFSRVLELSPQDTKAHDNLDLALSQQGTRNR